MKASGAEDVKGTEKNKTNFAGSLHDKEYSAAKNIATKTL